MSMFLNKTIPYNEFQNKNKIMSQSTLLTPIAYKLVSHLGYTLPSLTNMSPFMFFFQDIAFKSFY